MSQWGTVTLAEKGLTALEILRHYYPKDLEIVVTNNISDNTSSYPGYALRLGSSGPDVVRTQRLLNRIRTNFPAIPLAGEADGVFGQKLLSAVTEFQKNFRLTVDGVVGLATWLEITRVYTAVTKMAELTAEGLFIDIGASPPTGSIRQNSVGSDVAQLQFLLNYISQFHSTIRPVVETSFFCTDTKDSVISFQTAFGLTSDGIVGPASWKMLYDVYKGIKSNVGTLKPQSSPTIKPYPGFLIALGSVGDFVKDIQNAINALNTRYTSIHRLTADGKFGLSTENSVKAFQWQFGLSADGKVGLATWNSLMQNAASSR
jgi:peptidoglycan hydrolase-like protein with peptidoglycan-binding domain